MVQFDTLIRRAGDETLQKLIGRDSLRLLYAIDKSLTSPSRLREILLDLRSPQQVLASTESRRLLFDLLERKEAKSLSSILDVEHKKGVYQALKKVRIYKNSSREELLYNFFNLDSPERKETEKEPTEKLLSKLRSLSSSKDSCQKN